MVELKQAIAAAMNWIRENKFLTGFIAVLVVGVGVLGYLLYSAYGDYSDVSDQYTAQAAKLNQLQSLTPYPDEENLRQIPGGTGEGERRDPGAGRQRWRKWRSRRGRCRPRNFRTGCAPVSPPSRPRPSSWASSCRSISISVSTDTRPSRRRPSAASALGQELAAIENAMNIVLDSHVESIVALNRPPLPEEQPRAARRPEAAGGLAAGGPRAGGGGAAAEADELVQKIPFHRRLRGHAGRISRKC